MEPFPNGFRARRVIAATAAHQKLSLSAPSFYIRIKWLSGRQLTFSTSPWAGNNTTPPPVRKEPLRSAHRMPPDSISLQIPSTTEGNSKLTDTPAAQAAERISLRFASFSSNFVNSLDTMFPQQQAICTRGPSLPKRYQLSSPATMRITQAHPKISLTRQTTPALRSWSVMSTRRGIRG